MKDRIATINKTSDIMHSHFLNAKKSFGQNFMIDPKIPSLIASNPLICKGGLVIEIGPGLGALTQFLLEKAKKVICYEIDEQLANILKDTLKDYDNLEVINQDFLKVDLNMHEFDNYSNVVVVSNLPYYITSEILIKLFKIDYPFVVIAMMQKEVASRILKGKEQDRNELSIIANLFTEVEKYCEVSKNDFFPRPNVDSTVLQFTLKDKTNKELTEEVVRVLYQQKRKTILNNLNNYVDNPEQILSTLNIPLNKRIDELSFNDLERLINHIIAIKSSFNIVKRSYAKINIGLRVVKKHEDGMHEIESIFAPISLYDTLKFSLNNEGKINITSNNKDVPLDEKNLCYKVVEKYKELTGLKYGVNIDIDKQIPLGSGLGGGSSNAAVTLEYLNDCFNLLDEKQSIELLRSISQDSIFFYHNMKIKYGYGYPLKFKDYKYEDKHVILAKKSKELSTKEVYEKYDLLGTTSNEFKPNINDLENAAISIDNDILKIKKELSKYDLDVSMSGSGNCVYGLINDLHNATGLRNIKADWLWICKILDYK